MSEYILWLHEVEMSDVDRVGGRTHLWAKCCAT